MVNHARKSQPFQCYHGWFSTYEGKYIVWLWRNSTMAATATRGHTAGNCGLVSANILKLGGSFWHICSFEIIIWLKYGLFSWGPAAPGDWRHTIRRGWQWSGGQHSSRASSLLLLFFHEGTQHAPECQRTTRDLSLSWLQAEGFDQCCVPLRICPLPLSKNKTVSLLRKKLHPMPMKLC